MTPTRPPTPTRTTPTGHDLAPASDPSTAPAAAQAMPLDDLLCFGLYSASRNLTAVYRPLLDEVGLTYPQYLVLLVLWSSKEVAVRDLVEQIQLDYGTLSPLLKRMEAAGLITRHRRPEDERSVLITLTEEGRDMEARTQGIDPALDAAVHLDEDEMATLLGLLRRVSGSCINYVATR